MNIKNILNFSYWSDLRPDYFSGTSGKVFFAGLIILFLTALLAAVLKRKSGFYRGFLKRLYSFAVSNFLVGLLILFFRFELVPFLSARFWFGLWLLTMLVWLIFILKALKKIPEAKKKAELSREKEKYIP
jgi:hypothetical protein